jgi:hypothetical protein
MSGKWLISFCYSCCRHDEMENVERRALYQHLPQLCPFYIFGSAFDTLNFCDVVALRLWLPAKVEAEVAFVSFLLLCLP